MIQYLNICFFIIKRIKLFRVIHSFLLFKIIFRDLSLFICFVFPIITYYICSRSHSRNISPLLISAISINHSQEFPLAIYPQLIVEHPSSIIFAPYEEFHRFTPIKSGPSIIFSHLYKKNYILKDSNLLNFL